MVDNVSFDSLISYKFGSCGGLAYGWPFGNIYGYAIVDEFTDAPLSGSFNTFL